MVSTLPGDYRERPARLIDVVSKCAWAAAVFWRRKQRTSDLKVSYGSPEGTSIRFILFILL